MRAPASSVARPEPNPFESAEAAALARQTLNVGGLGIDWDRIDATLADPAARLDDYRSLLRSANAALGQLFLANTPIEQLVRDRAAVVDRVIQSAWNRYAAQLQKRVSLVAVGGYGRHELHPSSDVDLLFILPDRKPRQYGQSIATFLAFLWDIGLEVGHSARTVAECREESKRDMTIATSVMESRLLAGPEELFERMQDAVGPSKIWPARTFFEAKLKEQRVRHHSYDDTAYNLEPNIKGSPGGLRDIQVIIWVATRYFGTGKLEDLVEHEFLTPAQLAILRDGREFLWRIRFALHLITGRREDRLLFDHQAKIASLFGYEDASYTLAVEQFMQRYYRTVMELSRVNEMLLQLFQEAILMNPDAPPEPLTDDFQVRNGFLQVTSDDVFQSNPSALLEIFLLLQQHPELNGVSAYTIALIRRNLHRIDDEFRQSPKNHRLFLQILHAPEGVTHELRRMNLYGVLGQYIPNFGRIVGRMQYDLFHAYTVDEHTLFVVSNLRRFALKRFDHEFPLCSEIMKGLPVPEIAYLAGLFHDIAKGRGGDHSELGAVDAEAYCLEHGMSRYEARLVAWLVRHHLALSLTAQKKDVNDQAVIRDFATLVGDETHLDYLYLLTVADVRATSPKLWNSWKAQLFEELYELTKRALRTGLGIRIDKEELLLEKKQAARQLLGSGDVSDAEIDRIWANLGEEYFLRCRSEEISWHTRLLVDFEPDRRPFLADVQNDESSAGTTIFLYTPQVDFTFASATAVLDEFGLTIVDARIIPLENDYSVSVYVVLEQNGQRILDPARCKQLQQRLRRAVDQSDGLDPRVTRRAPRQVRLFSTSTMVSYLEDEKNSRTVIELVTGDRPGLLSEVGKVLRENNVYILNAKILTVGERAEDVFFVTDEQDRPLNEATCETLKHSLVTALEESA